MELAQFSSEAWRLAVSDYVREIKKVGHEKSPFWLLVRTFASVATEADDPESFYDDLDSGFIRELTEGEENNFDLALSHYLSLATSVLVSISEAYNEENEELCETLTDEIINGILGGLADQGLETMNDSDLLNVTIRILHARLSLYDIPIEETFSVATLDKIPNEEERDILEPLVGFLLEEYKEMEDPEDRFVSLMQILFDTLWTLFYLGLEEGEEELEN
ncbi:hypothetical protein CH373_11185 [Leptospira perolatii]|uniref:Uncharacterized protein n=1 Tax=Leptospira perolatii TaxID=2023191 RepID=A0A2M9ZLU8_9LEPT|nr:hypothetical protein [Leptospira perolatii]PJZ69733.1 hypothetical protein CH360_09050 [Leptospira perolatii]PJZ73052.1 hypothetical protein CH373_11185 [Leptospira perolatii]